MAPPLWLQVTRVFCYLTVVTLQYLTPILLILFSTLALKSLGKTSPPLKGDRGGGTWRSGITEFNLEPPFLLQFSGGLRVSLGELIQLIQ